MSFVGNLRMADFNYYLFSQGYLQPWDTEVQHQFTTQFAGAGMFSLNLTESLSANQ
jgi:hypothetical protein